MEVVEVAVPAAAAAVSAASLVITAAFTDRR